MRRLRLFWMNDGGGIAQGTAFGYATHTRSMIKALGEAGVERAKHPNDSYDFSVCISAPYQFRPIMGRRNILFTMCEQVDLPPWGRPLIGRRADLIMVPTTFSRNEFSKHYAVPIETVPEGIDPGSFPFCERRAPKGGEPFVYLHNGVSDSRKGASYIWAAWCERQKTGRLPGNAWLYFKTTARDPQHGGTIDVCEKTRVILDSRVLSRDKLLALYRQAHAFVYPSQGEGWGLGLVEAQATGLPSIYTKFSALADWPDHSAGYPLTRFKLVTNWSLAHHDLNLNMTDFIPPTRGTTHHRPKGLGNSLQLVAKPDIGELADAMRNVYDNFDEALERGRRASAYIHENFTWAKAAQRFIEVCEKYRDIEPKAAPNMATQIEERDNLQRSLAMAIEAWDGSWGGRGA